MNPLDLLKDAAGIIKTSPFAAISLVVLGALVAALFFHERISTLEQRLVAKDEEAGRYKARVELLDKASATMAGRTNAQLREKAAEIGKTIRAIVIGHQQREAQISAPVARGWELPEEARGAAWDKMVVDSSKELAFVDQQYNQRVKADVLALRDEMLSRGGPTESASMKWKNAAADHVFEFPTGTIGMEKVATELEVMAKKLPE